MFKQDPKLTLTKCHILFFIWLVALSISNITWCQLICKTDGLTLMNVACVTEADYENNSIPPEQFFFALRDNLFIYVLNAEKMH